MEQLVLVAYDQFFTSESIAGPWIPIGVPNFFDGNENTPVYGGGVWVFTGTQGTESGSWAYIYVSEDAEGFR